MLLNDMYYSKIIFSSISRYDTNGQDRQNEIVCLSTSKFLHNYKMTVPSETLDVKPSDSNVVFSVIMINLFLQT